MKVHFLIHLPYKEYTFAENWVLENRHTLSRNHLLEEDFNFPEPETFDLLVVLGGIMSVNDESEYPWLVKEKKYIESVMKRNKKVLGVCFGSQLLADVLGAKVYKHEIPEVGWHEISLLNEAEESLVFKNLPDKFVSFVWHYDTFDIPAGCTRLARSEACKNQAFEYGTQIIGLQFHPEFTLENIKRLLKDYGNLIVESEFSQSPELILSKKGNFKASNNILKIILEKMTLSI